MPHECLVYVKSYDMAKATMCAYPHSYHTLPHWKCVLQCCAKCPSVNLPDQETYSQYPNTRPSNGFHIYHLIARFITHGRLLLTDKKICRKFEQDTESEKSTKIYTRKEPLMMETTISNFHTSFYIPDIHKLAFHIPHVQILGTNHCSAFVKLRLNTVNNFKMCYVVVIMLKG